MARNWHHDSTTVVSAYPEPSGPRRPRYVVVVGVLAALSAAVAAIISAVSLTRIAGGLIGFPEYLEWTFTGAVDIGAAAGAVLWVTSTGDNRHRGQWLNIACSTVSAVGVGLDHASHAEAGWEPVAFAIGAFLPALSTWLIHVLAHLVTETEKIVDTPELGLTEHIEPASVTTNGHASMDPEAVRRAADAERKRKQRADRKAAKDAAA